MQMVEAILEPGLAVFICAAIAVLLASYSSGIGSKAVHLMAVSSMQWLYIPAATCQYSYILFKCSRECATA